MEKIAPLIEFSNVSLLRGSRHILRSISWRLGSHEHWAILGPNGSGKSTLLRLACGYLWPTEGSIQRMGESHLDLRILRESFGWVSSDLLSQIPDQDTVIDTVLSGRFNQISIDTFGKRKPEEKDYLLAKDLLLTIGCQSLTERSFGSLSQGEKQQILIARARIAQPLCIVLDEPCSGMDPGVRERFLSWLHEIACLPEGPSLLFVTHHVEEIMPCFEFTLALKDGESLEAGPTLSVLQPALLESLYEIRVPELVNLGGRFFPTWQLLSS